MITWKVELVERAPKDGALNYANLVRKEPMSKVFNKKEETWTICL